MCGICGCSGSDDNTSNNQDNVQSLHRFNHGKISELKLDKIQHREQKHIEQHLLHANDHRAMHNRETLQKQFILALNLVSSPGSGKTTLLEQTLKVMHPTQSCYVIEGDQQTLQDAQRIAETGVDTVQVNTGAGCHLDAQMVAQGMQQFDMERGGFLFIENVGNLVCPALFDLGEAAKVAVISVTEGEDKPLKYPHMFKASQLMIINKMDLLPYVPFDVDKCIAYARQVNPNIQVIKLSALKQDGMDQWFSWLRQARESIFSLPSAI